jgi:hypothetical protein
MTTFSGAARPITAPDVAKEATLYGIDLPGCRALMDVESKNKGFDNKKRPIILFEPHVFYRQLRGTQRDLAEQKGLAYPHWGERAYPSGQDAQYKRLAAAIAINEEAAYRAISMGMGQVLGENYAVCGCTSAKQMFEFCLESEANQLQCMMEYLKGNHLLHYVNTHNWLALASGYNGKGQAKKYAGWLKKAHDRWARILSKPREDLDAQDLKDAGSQIVTAADFGQKVVKTAAVVGPTAGVMLDAATKGMEPVTQAVQTAQQAQSAWEWVRDNWEFLAVLGLTAVFLVLCYLAYKAFHNVIHERVENARNGMNLRI